MNQFPCSQAESNFGTLPFLFRTFSNLLDVIHSGHFDSISHHLKIFLAVSMRFECMFPLAIGNINPVFCIILINKKDKWLITSLSKTIESKV